MTNLEYNLIAGIVVLLLVLLIIVKRIRAVSYQRIVTEYKSLHFDIRLYYSLRHADSNPNINEPSIQTLRRSTIKLLSLSIGSNVRLTNWDNFLLSIKLTTIDELNINYCHSIINNYYASRSNEQ